MTKKLIIFTSILAISAAVAGAAFGGFDKTPTSALEDRRESAEATKKIATTMELLLAETKRTNELLNQLVQATDKAPSNRR